jgi:hypothetical protein
MSRTDTPELVSYYRSTPGRRAFASSQVVAAAGTDYPEVAALAKDAHTHDEGVIVTQRKWLQSREDAAGAESNAEVVAAERSCDRIVGSLFRVLQELSTLSSPRGGAAKRVLRAYFSGGAEAITGLSFAEEATTIGVMLTGLAGPDAAHRADVETAGVDDYITELATAHARFDAALRGQKAQRVITWDEVRTQDKAGQTLFADLIVAILYFTRGPDKAADRQRLLHPIEVQNEALRELYRTRRNVADVDPNTGEDVAPDPALPSEPVAP